MEKNPAYKYAPLNSWRAAPNKFANLDKRKNVRELWTANPPPSPEEERRDLQDLSDSYLRSGPPT